jgi:hypothetical protein
MIEERMSKVLLNDITKDCGERRQIENNIAIRTEFPALSLQYLYESLFFHSAMDRVVDFF